MKNILRDNALESWAMAIKYCNDIMEGKATLTYRKFFVSSLHNAVELFVKQLMINNNDYRVVTFKNISKDASPAKEYYNSDNLNEFFLNLNPELMKKVYSIEFNKIIDYSKELFSAYYDKYGVDEKYIVGSGLKTLSKLRNDETHFWIDKNEFLTDIEFLELYNFMVSFNSILHFYHLMPFWGRPSDKNKSISFMRRPLQSFCSKKVVKNAKFVKRLKQIIETKDFQMISGDSAYEIAKCIYNESDGEYKKEDFNELWIYIEMLLKYNLLTWRDETEIMECETEYGKEAGQLVNRRFYVKI